MVMTAAGEIGVAIESMGSCCKRGIISWEATLFERRLLSVGLDFGTIAEWTIVEILIERKESFDRESLAGFS